MRIIRFFSSTLIFIVFLMIIGIYFGRELLLIMATSDLKRAANTLVSTSHLVNCYDGFSRSPSAWGQIRFTDERNYVLETVCSDFPKKPIFIESKTLPVFVKKVDGASGFLFNSTEKNASKILLNALGKELTIFKEINELATGEAPTIIDYGSGPASECRSFNYQCCQNDIERGVGNRQELATDCAKDCYQSCHPRPLIISFNGMPANSGDKRIVNIRSGQAVAFAFVVGDGKKELFGNQIIVNNRDKSFGQWKSRLQTVVDLISNIENKPVAGVQPPITTTIFFGDGQSYTTQSLQEVTDHVYTCGEELCHFEAWIEAQDARLTNSVDHESTRLKIIVSN